jgi:hypothetical protein
VPTEDGLGVSTGDGLGVPTGDGLGVSTGDGLGVPTGDGLGVSTGDGLGVPAEGGLGVPTKDGLGAEGEGEDGVGLSASAVPPVSVATEIAHTDASAPAPPRQELRGPCPRGLRAVDGGVICAVSRLSRAVS